MKAVVAGLPGSEILLDPVTAGLSAEGWSVTRFYGGRLEDIVPARWIDAEILVCYGLACGTSQLQTAPRLRGIVSPTIGHEWIDEAAASALGILVVNGAVPENQESMAEAAILLLLAALYDLPGAQAVLRGSGQRRTPPRMLKGKTIGLLGYGNIAKAIIARLQGWGVDLIVHRRAEIGADERVRFVSLAALLESSDILLPLASLNRDSRGIIDAAALDRMKTGAVLVNIARGEIIDEKALAERLADGRLSMAALDVFETEPLPSDSPLRTLSNAILTPHAVGHTIESFAAIPATAIENALMLSRWEVPASTRNTPIVKAWLNRRG